MPTDFFNNELQKGNIVLFAKGTSLHYAKVTSVSGSVVYLEGITTSRRHTSRPANTTIKVNARHAFSDAMWSRSLPDKDVLPYSPHRSHLA